ncbi:unnamed protein product [Sordaria macrospora k-hell]|uniref:WGS project CABT00000000 data, contig 2.1 n=2 Tax=Sordaria macrospora TaxID=5147 RepID=F7VL41_SORMK|nr:uncharacterized protein SMAC_00435 [Sordaria macrospora k-hell]CCC06218.1 unnamed protein product [Sordaria macrospora k-hell]
MSAPDTYAIAIATPHRGGEVPITFLCGHTSHKGRTYEQVVPSLSLGASIISKVLPGLVMVPPYPNDNAPVPCKVCRENKVWEYDWRRRVWVKKVKNVKKVKKDV